MYPPYPTLLLEALVDDRIRELRRDADAWRLNAVGFWLVGAGLRLALAGPGRRPSGR